jgi:hypothetical protein
MQRFRLVKVNESLKGKLKRIEDELQEEKAGMVSKLDGLAKSAVKNKSSFSVQVSTLKSSQHKRKTIPGRTEQNLGVRMSDMDIWKEKWGRTERKLQEVLEGLKRCYEHFVFTKNGSKVIESLKAIIGECENRGGEAGSPPKRAM